MRYEHKHGVELESLFHKVFKNKKLLHEFLFDILSPVEYKELAIRWQIVKMLKSNTPHRDIAKNLKVGIVTVTRGSRELANKKGGDKRIWRFCQKGIKPRHHNR